ICGGETCAEPAAAVDDAIHGRTLIAERAEDRFVLRVVAYEAEARFGNAVAGDLAARHHADPVAVLPAAMAGMEREAAEPIENRLAAMALYAQPVMAPVPDHDVGTGIERPPLARAT